MRRRPGFFEGTLPLGPGRSARFGFTTRRFPLFFSHSTRFLGTLRALGRPAPAVRGLFCDPAVRLAHGIQVHSNRVARVGPESFGRSREHVFPATDGLVTALEGTRALAFSADCLPVILAAPGPRPAVAILHAGWKGTARGIAAKGVAGLRRLSGAPASRIRAVLGPALRACCYEVGPEFRRRFPRTTRVRGGKVFFDLVAENRRQLVRAGVRPQAIRDTGWCTSCRRDLFYSYRREGERAGRLVSWVELRPAGVISQLHI